MSSGRELRLTRLLGVLGALLVIVAAGRDRVTLTFPQSPPLHDERVTSTGGDLRPDIAACAYVGLVGMVAVVAARTLLRRVVGALLCVAGVLVAVRSLVALADRAGLRLEAVAGHGGCPATSSCLDAVARAGVSTGWPLVAGVGGVVLALAGALVAWRGGRAGGLGSSYEAPGGKPVEPVTDKGVWDALDRGDDPTT